MQKKSKSFVRPIVESALSHIKNLGSLFESKYSLEEALEQLNHQLAELDDSCEFINASGWENIKKVLRANIRTEERMIASLGNNPIKHADEIRLRYCIKAVSEGFLKVSDEFIRRQLETKKEIDKHERSAEAAGMAVGGASPKGA